MTRAFFDAECDAARALFDAECDAAIREALAELIAARDTCTDMLDADDPANAARIERVKAAWCNARIVLASAPQREPMDGEIVDAQIGFCQREDIAGTALVGDAVEYGFRAGYAAAVPPREPTQVMLDAGVEGYANSLAPTWTAIGRAWRAMWDAAPRGALDAGEGT